MVNSKGRQVLSERCSKENSRVILRPFHDVTLRGLCYRVKKTKAKRIERHGRRGRNCEPPCGRYVCRKLRRWLCGCTLNSSDLMESNEGGVCVRNASSNETFDRNTWLDRQAQGCWYSIKLSKYCCDVKRHRNVYLITFASVSLSMVSERDSFFPLLDQS